MRYAKGLQTFQYFFRAQENLGKGRAVFSPKKSVGGLSCSVFVLIS